MCPVRGSICPDCPALSGARARVGISPVREGLVDRKIRMNIDKKLLGTGLALVVVGVVMAKSFRCNRFCKFIASELATTGSSRFVKAFLV